MKKILFSALLLSGVSYGQNQIIDFDTLTLPQSQNFWNGSDISGGFTDGTAFFNNTYNTTYNFWSGFAYSAATDNTTSGIGNQYSAFPGIGAAGSVQYGVWYGDGVINFSNPQIVDSIKVSNGTYPAISMRDGDSFGKQFGSPNAADGTPDGTNGEDWFLLTIYGLDVNDDTVGTVEFYLADYRFSDNTQDYIVDTWKNVDLSSLGEVKKLAFGLTSSDVGQYGMNTPGYFVIDNIATHSNIASIIQLNKVQAQVYPNPTSELVNLKFENSAERNIVVINTAGVVVKQMTSQKENIAIPVQNWSKGMYFIKVISQQGTYSTRLIVQ